MLAFAIADEPATVFPVSINGSFLARCAPAQPPNTKPLL